MGKRRQFGVNVSSYLYCGALNAEHYYVDAWWYDTKGKYHKEKVEQPCTAKMALHLNKKDSIRGNSTFFRYKRGDMTERFDTKAQAVKAGIKFLTEKFGHHIVIEEGSVTTCDNKIVYNKGLPL